MVPQKVSQSNDESSVLETHAPGVGATTNTQEDLADHAGANREGSVGPLSITPDDLEGVHSDTARFDESIKMPEEEDATGHAQQGLADKDNTEGDTSFGSSNEGSAPGTASTFGGSEGTGASEVIDRDAAMADILEMLGMWPEITLALIDFTGKPERFPICYDHRYALHPLILCCNMLTAEIV